MPTPPTWAPPEPTPPPASGEAASQSAGDPMCCYDAGCSTYGTSFCNAAGTWCSGSADACQTCGGTLCTDPAGTYGAHSATTSSQVPTPSPAPAPAAAPPAYAPPPSAPAPTPSPSDSEAAEEAQCCVYGGCASYGTPYCIAAGLWCSGSDEACSTCGGTLCTGLALLSEGPPRAEKFLHRPGHGGHILLQTLAAPRRGGEVEGVIS